MLSKDEVEKLKETLKMELAVNLNNLVGFINRMNLNPLLKQHSFLNLDQCKYWVTEAIGILSFEEPKPPMQELQPINLKDKVEDKIKEEVKKIA
jgi:hypothetical protein